MSHSINLPVLMICSLTFLLSSCISYQYATLNSDLPRSQYRDFFYENDTLQIVFSFSGIDCPVNVDIYNKLDTNIYINRYHSALDVNGAIWTLYPRDWTEEQITITNDEGVNTITKYTDTSSDETSPNKDQYLNIPPKTQISGSQYHICNHFLPTTLADSISRSKVNGYSNMKYRVKKHFFIRQNSPLRFRCYITYTDDPELPDKHIMNSNFWVGHLYNSTNECIITSADTYRVAKKPKTENIETFINVVGLAATTVASYYLDGEE